MKYFLVKVKGKDLFFNADEGNGECVCDTPILMEKDQADSVMSFVEEIYDIMTDDVYTIEDLEIKEVELKFI